MGSSSSSDGPAPARGAVLTRVADVIQPYPHMDQALNPARLAAHKHFDDNGYDVYGRLEVPILWGQQDIFRHVNNVHYSRHVESSRMWWLATLATELGKEAADGLVNGHGTGIILKDSKVNFRAPVTYPDSLIWAVKVQGVDQEKGRFTMSHGAWSLKDNRLVATSDVTIVIYDYDKNAKGKLSDKMRDVFQQRALGIEGVRDKAKL